MWRIAKSVARLKKQNSPIPPILSQVGRILVHPIDKALIFLVYQVLIGIQNYQSMNLGPLILNLKILQYLNKMLLIS